jgi:tetratricopeptide (TPR) repeat protein
LEYYRNAGKVDAEYALLDWRMALALDRLGRKAEALECYLKARDNDVCPLRTRGRHEAILDQIATETGTPLVDAAALFASKSPDGIPGNNWYLDHVHPTIGGHQKIAQAIVARLRQIGLVSANSTWPEEQRRAAYARHLKRLGPNYLADGRRRVEWLENWARRERLLAEASPKDARGYLHSGFRRLDFGDELGAWEAFSEALKLDGGVAGALQEQARELADEGRADASAGLRRWLGRSEH